MTQTRPRDQLFSQYATQAHILEQSISYQLLYIARQTTFFINTAVITANIGTLCAKRAVLTTDSFVYTNQPSAMFDMSLQKTSK